MRTIEICKLKQNKECLTYSHGHSQEKLCDANRLVVGATAQSDRACGRCQMAVFLRTAGPGLQTRHAVGAHRVALVGENILRRSAYRPKLGES
jgi:hypothetical protein